MDPIMFIGVLYASLNLWFFAGVPAALLSKFLPPAGIRLLVGLIVLITSTAIEMIAFLLGVIKSPYTLDTNIVIAVHLAGFLGFALFSWESSQFPDIDYTEVAGFASFIVSLAVCFLATAGVYLQLERELFLSQGLFVVPLVLLIVDLYYVLKRKVYLASTVVTGRILGVDVEWHMPEMLPI